MANSSVTQDILYRLVLAKSLFRNADQIISDPTLNQYSLATGLLNLHDSLDNFLGAAASQLNISIKARGTLLTTLDKIEEMSKIALIKTQEIRQLNQLRNDIKHKGIPPNVSFGVALLPPIKTFLSKYSQDFFSLSWETISLADIIKETAVRQDMKDVEQMITSKQYKKALHRMAEIKFQIFEYSDLTMYLGGRFDLFMPPSEQKIKARQKQYVFTSDIKGELFSDIYERIKSVEKGIDLEKMKQFESLTAECGVQNDKSKRIIFKHGSNWAAPNWTKQNALFCFNYLIDIILKTQQKEKEFTEKMIFHEQSILVRDSDIKINSLDREGRIDKEVGRLIKNRKYEAWIGDYKDGRWENFGEPILISIHDNPKIVGYIDDKDRKKIIISSTKEIEAGELYK
ncbi:hypothetical protein KKG41_03060 [Patescibacteria group bacterium]|nr:hypothetical protein [Patescibacteria group bacterium]MBU1890251.1 hypothetical protein [Patescibacteria group bacterium]